MTIPYRVHDSDTIIVSFYEYTVYNVLNYDALWLLLLLLSFFVQISLLFAV